MLGRYHCGLPYHLPSDGVSLEILGVPHHFVDYTVQSNLFSVKQVEGQQKWLNLFFAVTLCVEAGRSFGSREKRSVLYAAFRMDRTHDAGNTRTEWVL